MQRSYLLVLGCAALVLGSFAGCDEESLAPTAPVREKPAAIGGRFDASQAGTITGHVRWHGDAPKIESFKSTPYPVRFPRGSGGRDREWPNPNAPQIDPKTRGIADAVVYLEGVDLERSRPWDHPAVTVEQHDHQYQVIQGNRRARIGFVRRGRAVTLLSTDREFYSLRARGAAFFTLIIPDPNEPLQRVPERNGIAELSSGAGHYWMRGYLFVDDHPYYARTDHEGRFTLPQVPPGKHKLTIWMPNWHVARREQDWETSLTSNVDFAPSLVQSQSIIVEPGKTAQVELTVTADDFLP